MKLVACYLGAEVPTRVTWAHRHRSWTRPAGFTRCRGCGKVIAVAGGTDPERVRRWHVSTSTCSIGEGRRPPTPGCRS